MFLKYYNTKKFGFPPKYGCKVKVNFTTEESLAISCKAIEVLNWDIVFISNSTIEAKRFEKGIFGDIWTEIIIFEFNERYINIVSQSIGGKFFDNGKNFKSIQDFKRCFEFITNTYSKENLLLLFKNFEKNQSVEEFLNFKEVTQPNNNVKYFYLKEISLWFIVMIIFSAALALISLLGIYKFFVFELIVSWLIAQIAMNVIPIDIFIYKRKHNLFLKTLILGIFIMCPFFQFFILIFQTNLQEITLIDYFYFLFIKGLNYNGFEISNYKLILFWTFQMSFIYLVTQYFLTKYIYNFILKRIPDDVFKFAIYNVIHGKNKDDLKVELEKVGWESEFNQNQVFDALEVHQSILEINRLK